MLRRSNILWHYIFGLSGYYILHLFTASGHISFELHRDTVSPQQRHNRQQRACLHFLFPRAEADMAKTSKLIIIINYDKAAGRIWGSRMGQEEKGTLMRVWG